MAVDERSSPQTGDQLRSKSTTDMTTTACEAASATTSHQPSTGDCITTDDIVSASSVVNGAARTGGRGRRKQCRPVRVCLTDDSQEIHDDVAVNTKPLEVNTLPEVVNLPSQNVCEICGAESTSPEALTAHAETCRGRGDPASDDVNTGGRAFPTRYHELGDELMRGAETALLLDGRRHAGNERSVPACSRHESLAAAYCSNGRRDETATCGDEQLRHAGDSELEAPLDFTLHSTQLVTTSSSSSHSAADISLVTSSVARLIKQPPQEMTSLIAAVPISQDAEDFCEFCQKHFCNKYYLRKHRHDVHGITASETQPQITQLLQQRQSASSFLPHDALPLLALTSEALTSVASTLSAASSSASPHQLSFQTPLMSSFVAPFATSTTSTSSVLFPTSPSAADLAASPTAAAAGLLPSLTSLMLLNPFASSLALLNSPSFLHQTSPAAAAAAAYSASSSLNTLAELQKSNAAAAAVAVGGFGGLCDDVAALGALMNPFLPPSDPVSSLTIEDPMSSSHYCELCRKEFCSDYFLTVHRRDKHGIATSTALSDAIRLLAAGNVPRPPAESQLSGGTEPGEKLCASASAGLQLAKSHTDRPSTHPDSSRSTSSDAAATDRVCCLCKKQFPNRYGLVLHLLSAHNIRPEGFGLAGELLQLDGVGGRSHATPALGSSVKSAMDRAGHGPGLQSTSSSTSSKQSDRVSCDICNKEVCNKYFLKTHKMKVHGLDSASAAIYNPPPPLDSSRCDAPAFVSSSSRHHHHQQQQQQHDDMRKAILMADSHFSNFASHLDLALKSVASADLPGSAGFGFLPPSLQQPQQPGDPMMTASDIFRLFGLVGSKQDDPFLPLGPPPPPPLSLQSLLPNADLPDPMGDAGKHSKPVELKIPKHVAGMTYHHKDVAAAASQQTQQPCRAKHSSSHHHSRHGRDQTTSRQSTQSTAGAAGPSDQQLIQSGIDPEAFCELCQKEFCSKYFLRTHRQKIHGVSSSKTIFDHYRPMSQQTAAACNPVLQIFPGLPLPSQSILAPGPSTLLPSAGAGPLVDPISDSATGQSAGVSCKDASNAARVTCDVCGKELCNKYFLKTHMTKVHGYADRTGTAALTASGHIELDAQPPDTFDNQTSTDYMVQRSTPPRDDCPPTNGSLSCSSDNGNISPLLDGCTSLRQPQSGNCIQDTGNVLSNGSNGETGSKKETLLHTQEMFTKNEPIRGAVENGEERILETDHQLTTAQNITSCLAAEPQLEAARQQGADAGQLRGKKRDMRPDDDDLSGKRARTDNRTECTAFSADQVSAEGHRETDGRERSDDTTPPTSAGVIQFVSRSKESTDSDMFTEDVQTPAGVRDSWSRGISAGVVDCTSSVTTHQDCNPTSRESDKPAAASYSTVNGHIDARGPTSTRWGHSTIDDGQRTSPLMQPFIMRPEPAPRGTLPGTGGSATVTSGELHERSEFAACRLVLPVVKPVRDPVTVEFCVTPVSSD